MLIRPATPADAAAMTAILNRIIAIGGTTAHQHADDVQSMCCQHYITGSERSFIRRGGRRTGRSSACSR